MVQDHLGNKYESQRVMCDFYHISFNVYRKRIWRGWTLEQALMTPLGTRLNFDPSPACKCTDHLGNEFSSRTAMCHHYNINTSTFITRMASGMSLEEALTSSNRKELLRVSDHLGQEFPSRLQMCVHWGVEYGVFRDRVDKLGWTVEEALTGKRNREKGVTDHLGNKFYTKGEMCKYWNVSYGTYAQRLRAGYSLREALEGIDISVIDHHGSKFKDVSSMCEEYGIDSRTYYDRLRRGLTKEEALTNEVHKKEQAVDHLGNKFATVREMCNYWNVNYGTYFSRLQEGKTLKESLTGQFERKPINGKLCEDHLGNKFESVTAMCRHWGISVKTFRSRTELCGWTKDKALTTSNLRNCKDHLGNKYSTKKEMAKAYGVDYHTLIDRLNHGWDVERALTEPASDSVHVTESGWKYNSMPVYISESGTEYLLCKKGNVEELLTLEELLTI